MYQSVILGVIKFKALLLNKQYNLIPISFYESKEEFNIECSNYLTACCRYCQSCGHIGAMLFKLAELISSGSTKMPDDLTCTELPCYWAEPKGS